MEKKRSVGVKLVTILVLPVFCLVLTSCDFHLGGAGVIGHLPPDHIKVGVPTTLEITFMSNHPGSLNEKKIQCHYRLTGEATFTTIPMVKMRSRKVFNDAIKKDEEERIYSYTLPAFSMKQKEQFGSVEYYLDFYFSGGMFEKESHLIQDYTNESDFWRKLRECKERGEDVIIVHDKTYKFSYDGKVSLDIEHPIPYRIPLVE
jgi:hypothetical protein